MREKEKRQVGEGGRQRRGLGEDGGEEGRRGGRREVEGKVIPYLINKVFGSMVPNLDNFQFIRLYLNIKTIVIRSYWLLNF